MIVQNDKASSDMSISCDSASHAVILVVGKSTKTRDMHATQDAFPIAALPTLDSNPSSGSSGRPESALWVCHCRLGHHTKLCSVVAELDFADTGVSYQDILSGSSVPLAVDFSSSLQMSNINGRKTVDLTGFIGGHAAFWRVETDFP